MEGLIRITPDKEKARNILKMISLIEKRIVKNHDDKEMASLNLADYYEIMKELMTAILSIDGYKTLGHKELIDYLKENCKEFSTSDTALLDELRILRNKITYDGYMINPSNLTRNEDSIIKIIEKLKDIVKDKLNII